MTSSTAGRTVPYDLDPRVYKRHAVIEWLFCRLKRWRHFAIRYDSLAGTFVRLRSWRPYDNVGQIKLLP